MLLAAQSIQSNALELLVRTFLGGAHPLVQRVIAETSIAMIHAGTAASQLAAAPPGGGPGGSEDACNMASLVLPDSAAQDGIIREFAAG